MKPAGAKCRLELVSCRFPARPLCEQGKLRSFIMGNGLNWRQVGFPRFGDGIVSQHESAIMLQAAEGFSIFEANIWGMLFCGTEIANDESGTLGIHLYHLVGCVLVFIKHAGVMFRVLGYSGPIIIETALASILGVQWLHFPNRRLFTRPGSELDDDVAFSVTTTSEALLEKPDGVSMDVLRYVFFSVNWPDLVDTPQRLEDLVRKGYEYNYWPEPTNLLI